jgi:hypothetical protein
VLVVGDGMSLSTVAAARVYKGQTEAGPRHPKMYTDKKENQIFLICREIQSGAVAKSYMRKDFLIYEEMRKYFPIYDEAVSI